jgi:hypothetical protein
MINFKDFIEEEITEQEIDELIESLEWEDIIELYDTEDLILDEDISSTQRIKMGQKMKSRKALLALARSVKLKRAAAMNVLTRRSKTAARKMVMRKMLKGRSKSELSAAEKNSIEARTSRVLSMMKNLPQKLLPKIREIEKKRLHGKDNK